MKKAMMKRALSAIKWRLLAPKRWWRWWMTPGLVRREARAVGYQVVALGYESRAVGSDTLGIGFPVKQYNKAVGVGQSIGQPIPTIMVPCHNPLHRFHALGKTCP